jgi:hypothetical protein
MLCGIYYTGGNLYAVRQEKARDTGACNPERACGWQMGGRPAESGCLSARGYGSFMAGGVHCFKTVSVDRLMRGLNNKAQLEVKNNRDSIPHRMSCSFVLGSFCRAADGVPYDRDDPREYEGLRVKVDDVVYMPSLETTARKAAPVCLFHLDP